MTNGAKSPHRRGRLPVRSGAAVVEVAFVAPVLFLFVIGTIVAGFGTFRQQQVAFLAREGARWASVRGKEYQELTNSPAPTADAVLANAIRPLAVCLKEQSLRCSLDWGPDRRTVRVTVQYDWVPESFLPPMTLTSATEMPVTN